MNGGLSQSARVMAQSHAAIVEQFAQPTLRQITVRAVQASDALTDYVQGGRLDEDTLTHLETQASDARDALLRSLAAHGVEPELAERILA